MARTSRTAKPAVVKARGADRRRTIGSTAAPPRKVNVFISYRREDKVIALELREAILNVNRDRIECFLDCEVIDQGKLFLDRINEELKRADWLVCIYTGVQSTYCGYEVGVFENARSGSSRGRLVALYDVQDEALPGLFDRYENAPIHYPPERRPSDGAFDEDAFYEKTDIAKFFRNLCKYAGLYVARDAGELQRQTKAITENARRITTAFWASHINDVLADTPTQLGVELSFGRQSNMPLVIPETAQVKGTYQSLGLFGIMPGMQGEKLPTSTWGAIKAANQSPYTPHITWMERLERDMLNAASDTSLAEPEAIFLSNQATRVPYRAILVRHRLHRDGTHRFEIVFVPTLPRHFMGDQKTSLILVGLIVASRFRFSYLEQPARIAARFADGVSDAEFDGNYRQFLHDLERMRIEAMELGLVDPTAFIESFGEARKGIAESFLTEWRNAKNALDEALPPAGTVINTKNRGPIREAMTTFLARMAVENARFLRVAIDAYRDELEPQLRPS